MDYDNDYFELLDLHASEGKWSIDDLSEAEQEELVGALLKLSDRACDLICDESEDIVQMLSKILQNLKSRPELSEKLTENLCGIVVKSYSKEIDNNLLDAYHNWIDNNRLIKATEGTYDWFNYE